MVSTVVPALLYRACPRPRASVSTRIPAEREFGSVVSGVREGLPLGCCPCQLRMCSGLWLQTSMLWLRTGPQRVALASARPRTPPRSSGQTRAQGLAGGEQVEPPIALAHFGATWFVVAAALLTGFLLGVIIIGGWAHINIERARRSAARFALAAGSVDRQRELAWQREREADRQLCKQRRWSTTAGDSEQAHPQEREPRAVQEQRREQDKPECVCVCVCQSLSQCVCVCVCFIPEYIGDGRQRAERAAHDRADRRAAISESRGSR